MTGIVRDLFGWPATWGTGGNMVAWAICGTLAFGWLHAKEKARHLAQMTLLREQHAKQMAQAQRHHEDLKRHVTAEAGGDRM